MLVDRAIKHAIFTIAAAFFAFPSHAANAPTLPVQPIADTPPGYDQRMPPPGPFEAHLDQLLQSRQYDALSHAIGDSTDPQAALRSLDWLRAQETAHGAGTFISFLYATMLWRVGGGSPEPQHTALRKSAASQLFLTEWTIRTEGFQCADAGSPDARLMMIGQSALTSAVKSFLDTLPAADQADVQRDAFTLLLLGFRHRGNDDWLCRSGAGYALKYAQKHPNDAGKEINVPGAVGRNIAIPDDPEIVPDFVPYATWKDRRDAAIAKLAGGLGMPLPPASFSNNAVLK